MPNNPPLFATKVVVNPLTGTEFHRSEITLRDLFAAFALAGQLANPKWPDCGEYGLPASEEECAAHWAYSFADAMLAEREKVRDVK